MRQLLGLLAASSLCLILSFGSVGCTRTAPKASTGQEKFAPETPTGKLTKDTSTISFTFHKDIKSVTPSVETDGVTPAIDAKDKKKITFTQSGALPDKDKSVKFAVKSSDEKDSDVTITITVAAAPAPEEKKLPVITDEDLKPATVAEKILLDKDGKGTATVKFTMGIVNPEKIKVTPETPGVTTKSGDKWVTIDVAMDPKMTKADTAFKVEVGAKGDKKAGATIDVTVVPLPPPVELVADPKATLKFNIAKKDLSETFKFNTKVASATVELVGKPAGKDVSAVVAEDKMSVTITFTTLAAAGVYKLKLKPLDTRAKDFELQVELAKPAP